MPDVDIGAVGTTAWSLHEAMDDGWSNEMQLLESRGVTLVTGLTDEEINRVELVHRFRFPPDLRSFLAKAMPLSTTGGFRFPDWRDPGSAALRDQLAGPFEGIAFVIERNAFWWKPWGTRPAALPDAIAVAKAAVEKAPRLIPIFGHRYLPAEPELAGNPVFSVHQTDIINYGTDLRRYLAN
jgi:hypothetical protein